MNLAIDIGNTRTKIGVFDQANLIHKEVWEATDLAKLTALATNHCVEKCIFSSTAHLQATFLDWTKQFSTAIELDSLTPIPIVNQYSTPHTLGKDRLAAVVGAYAFYPQQNCLIIDAGTCITYEFLTAEGIYLGGNIAPGLRMRARAMHEFTAKLPLIDIENNIINPIGNTTVSAMQNGTTWGAILESVGTIDYCKQHFGTTKVILTGGDAAIFYQNLTQATTVHANLVLHGLNKILNYNVETVQ
ncbi:MAG: type III pantothenate kinase [Saprospiraceae bacterium]